MNKIFQNVCTALSGKAAKLSSNFTFFRFHTLPLVSISDNFLHLHPE
jgi:hypothetical protein